MRLMKRLSFPVEIRDEAVGSVTVTSGVLVEKLGQPVMDVDDPDQYPGPVSLWAVETGDGMKIVVEFHKAKSWALIYAVPPDIRRAVASIGLSIEDVVWERKKER